MEIPSLIYGTAWKEEATTELAKTALSSGFRGIDTANQPKHYQEALVGEALQYLFQQGLRREDLFLQTKFTPVDGQDERVPYDPTANLKMQVWQSFEYSLTNLHTNYVDSYLLHGPYSSHGLGEEDWEVWAAMEEIYQSGKAKRIGISNVNRKQMELLLEKSQIKPMVVQNRCYASRGWDKSVRDFCKDNNIVYQGFSLLTANSFVLKNSQVKKIADRYGKSIPQVIFRFAIQVGMTPLTGTRSSQHMNEDLQIFDFELTEDEMSFIEALES